jgi:hypothetical protein
MLNIVHNKQEDISILHNTENITALDNNIAKLIDALNQELELSALFLISDNEKSAKSSLNARSLDDLKAPRIDVDTLLSSIKKSMTSEDIVVGEFNQQYLAELKLALITLREAIDANNISWQQIINFHIDWKNDFLSKLQSFSDQIRHKDIAKYAQ